jgi:hypothetical protein
MILKSCTSLFLSREFLKYADILSLWQLRRLEVWPGVFAMTTIAIALSDERVAQLRLRAAQVGLAPEEFLRRRVEQLLDRPDEQFRKAAAYVFQKNAELYRRLA